MIASFSYRGWAEYHSFVLSLRLVYLDDVEKLILVGAIQQDVHDLFEVVIRYNILPSWSEALGLSSQL